MLLEKFSALFLRHSEKTRFVSFRVIIPNLITTFALCAGVSAVQMALNGHFKMAVMFILLAAILDGVDGRLARALKGCSKFGAELDSLADFVNFGVVPALVLYIWQLHEIGKFGWLAVLIYIIAMALRLARFNVSDILEADGTQNTNPKSYFTGVPAPIGAILVLQPLFLSLAGFSWIETTPLLVLSALYMIVMACFLVSRLKTVSLKHLKLKAIHFIPVFMGFIVILGFLFTYTWLAFSILNSFYFAYLLVLVGRSFSRTCLPVKSGDDDKA